MKHHGVPVRSAGAGACALAAGQDSGAESWVWGKRERE